MHAVARPGRPLSPRGSAIGHARPPPVDTEVTARRSRDGYVGLCDVLMQEARRAGRNATEVVRGRAPLKRLSRISARRWDGMPRFRRSIPIH